MKLSCYLKIAAGLGAIVAVTSSCGILGDKKGANRTLAQSGSACLDEMGPLVESYIDGNVDEAKWVATWDCLDDTVDLFATFAQGSEESGYSKDDLRALVQKFVFSKKTVTPAFIDGLLAVKSSLLGGGPSNLTRAELDRYRELIRFLKVETARLIPVIRARKVDPSDANLRSFADAIADFGVRLADYLDTGKNPTLTKDMAVQFMRELAVAGLKMDPASMEEWAQFILETKVVLVNGAQDGISGADWAKIIRLGFKLGGTAIAYKDAQGEDPLFQNEMVDRVHSVLKASLAEWNGSLPFSRLERMVDTAPKSMLPRLAADFRIGVKKMMKPRTKVEDGRTVVYRPALSRLFLSKSDTGIDTGSIQRIVDDFHRGTRANWHLMNIYAGTKEDLTPAEFATRATSYSNRLVDPAAKPEVSRLITIGNRYPGLHATGAPEIVFGSQEKHSLTNLNRMNWYEIAAEHLMESYASTTNSMGRSAYLSDLTQLVDDVTPLLISFGIQHPLKTGMDAKRFREANLFMPNGNGDDQMDVAETSVYIAYLFSGGKAGSRITNLLLKGGSNPCPVVGWNVPLKEEVYDVRCFRENWLREFHQVFVNMPQMEADYQAMSPAEKDQFYRAIESASKATGYDDTPIMAFDMSSYAGLPAYAEAVMKRFDRNGDNALDRSEVLNDVFPIFKRELALISKIKLDFVNKAVLLYLMQNGEKPEVMDLISWALNFDFLKNFKARRIRIYQIFAALSPPVPGDPISQTPPPGAPGGPPLQTIAHGLVLGLTSPSSSTLASPTEPAPLAVESNFDLTKVDPTQYQGYPSGGPIVDSTSSYQEALEFLPQDL
jgi:hypothetical protein